MGATGVRNEEWSQEGVGLNVGEVNLRSEQTIHAAAFSRVILDAPHVVVFWGAIRTPMGI